MHFSDEPFAGHDAVLHWLRSDNELLGLAGNWYTGEVAGQKMECWLCPALFHYFQVAARTFYPKAEPLLSAGCHGQASYNAQDRCNRHCLQRPTPESRGTRVCLNTPPVLA